MWKKNIVERGRPGDNMGHAHCMLDKLGYKHTLRICKRFHCKQCLPEVASVLRYTYVVCLVVLGVELAVNNINAFSFVTEMQQRVPYALLTSHKILRTAVNSSKM